ncbi:MAG TPA: PKD domain-containing protein [Candidatus Pacearchaeota archaeon]|nr:PKD domain-containing protein [Candidatus Pacearchaeota archaeon]
MNSKLLFLTLIISSLFIVGSAQAYVAPSVYITELNLNTTEISLEDDQIQGNFLIWNSNDYIVPGIVSELVIMNLDEEGYPEMSIGRTLLDERFLLSPDQKQRVNFTYELPKNLLSGSYYFQVNIYSNSGLLMNWINQEVSIEGNERFVEISDSRVVKEDQEFSPLVGVVFDANDIPEIKFDLTNPRDEDIVVIPEITIFRRQINLERIDRLEESALTIAAQEKRTISYEMPSLNEPESYLAELKFYDQENQLISNSAFFRWVVAGSGAEVIAIETDSGAYQAGEAAHLKIHFVGAADGSQVGEADLLVVILDQTNEIAGEALYSVNLDDDNSLTVEVPMARETSNISVKASIIQADRTLTEYMTGPLGALPEDEEEIIQTDPEPSISGISWWYFFGAIILILLIFIIVKFLKNMKNKNKVLLSLFISSLIVFLGAALVTTEAAVEEYAKGNISLTWNRPIKDTLVVPGNSIEFSGDLKITSCFNHLPDDVMPRIKFYISDQQYPDDPAVLDNLGTYLGVMLPARVPAQNLSNKITIPNNFRGGDDGYAYIRVHFFGIIWGEPYELVASERVIIVTTPQAKNLEVNLLTGTRYSFSWDFYDPQGGKQSAYQVQVSPDVNFSTIEIDSGKVDSSSTIFTPNSSLAWGTKYYWQVKVWNQEGLNSGWTKGSRFTTPKHANPNVDFQWTPTDPSTYSEVTFVDISTLYGGSAKASWEWTFEDADITYSDQATPVVRFNSDGPKKVALRLTDSDGYSGVREKTVNVRLAIPDWREVSSD